MPGLPSPTAEAHGVPGAGAAFDPASLRAPFDAVEPMTVGLEEEAMLLDPATLDLAPVADRVLERLPDDGRFARELPAAQLEIVTRPCHRVDEAITQLRAARAALVRAAAPTALVAAAGVHPFTAVEGELNRGEHYDAIALRFGAAARRQLVAALQVHVAIGGADRTLAVHDALRCFLPELAALAANAPIHGGSDSGMASVRPLLSQHLPRQGIPPALGSWESLADELTWGRRTGAVAEPGSWWWELRPHLTHGTLELRVPDAQTTIADAAAVASVAQALAAWLAELHDRGEPLPSAPDWRIAENRWTALRDGLDGTFGDLWTGEPIAVRARLRTLLATIGPYADALGSADALRHADAMVNVNGAIRQRQIHDRLGPLGLTAWLAGHYEDDTRET